MSKLNDLLEVRKNIKKKKPNFIRQAIYRKKRLKNKWRRPKGIQSKLRLNKRGHRKKVQVGYKSPKEVRNLHSTGLKQKLVSSLEEINDIVKEEDGVIISGSVGLKKKIELIKKILEKNIKIINIKDPKEYLKKIEENLKIKREDKLKNKQIKDKKVKEKEKKSEEKKERKEEELAEKIEKEEKEKEKKEKDKLLTKRV